MDDSERQAVRQLYLMFIVASDRLAELGYDTRPVAGPVAAEVASILGVTSEHQPVWVRRAFQ